MEKRKARNSRYSLRAFASFLEIAPSTLSRIFTNGQELSVAATKKIMRKLGLTDEEKFLFIASVAEEKKFRTLQTLEKIPGPRIKNFRFTLESIVNLAMEKFSDGCIIHLRNGSEESILHARHRYGHFESGNFDILRSPVLCHPLLSPDKAVFIHRQGKHDDILKHLNAQSLLSIPVTKYEKGVGSITFLRTSDNNNFKDDDLLIAYELAIKVGYVYQLLVEV